MTYRAACALALAVYAAIVLISMTAPGSRADVTYGTYPLRALAALLLALAVLWPSSWADRVVGVYIAWFAVLGLLSLIGPLYQRFVPDSAGMTIYIDTATYSVAFASEIALIASALAWARRESRLGAKTGADRRRTPESSGGGN